MKPIFTKLNRQRVRVDSSTLDMLDTMKTSALRDKVIRLAHDNPELRPHLLPMLKQGADKVSAFQDGTVENWIHILAALLTQYDQRLSARESKRGISNIYRLGHLMGAVSKVRADTASVKDREDPEALEVFRKSVGRRFTDFPPIGKLLKLMDKFESTGKPPKYPVSRRSASIIPDLTSLADEIGKNIRGVKVRRVGNSFRWEKKGLSGNLAGESDGVFAVFHRAVQTALRGKGFGGGRNSNYEYPKDGGNSAVFVREVLDRETFKSGEIHVTVLSEWDSDTKKVNADIYVFSDYK